MFELGDKFNIRSLFDWEKNKLDERSYSFNRVSESFVTLCDDQSLPPKGIYFIGSRTVTDSFEKKVRELEANSLRWLFGKGHEGYKDGFLDQPYDLPAERLKWLKGSRAKNIKGLFENKVVSRKHLSFESKFYGYSIIGIADVKENNDSVYFKFWYFDCSKKLKGKIPPNGIDIQSSYEDGNGETYIYNRKLRGDVPIVSGILPGWSTAPNGSSVSYFKYGIGFYNRVLSLVRGIEYSDKPVRKIREEYELDHGSVKFSYNKGERLLEDILSVETNSNEKPDLLGGRSLFFEKEFLVEGFVSFEYNVTQVFISEGGKEIRNKVTPILVQRKFKSKALVFYVNNQKENVVYTQFNYFSIKVELMGKWIEKGKKLKFEDFIYKDKEKLEERLAN
ncbi:hypothetical protein [Tenacibaculum xiamenense]|uniref:hypothetical protein n=1 Tax=Tenacibaculum xiamenense TaxID=1261553 RepID=UPI003895CCA4